MEPTLKWPPVRSPLSLIQHDIHPAFELASPCIDHRRGLAGWKRCDGDQASFARNRIVGYSRTKEKRDFAVQQGIIDSASDSIEAACDGANVVVVASLVDQIAPLAKQAAASTPDDCLITDVGSTKAGIVESVRTCEAARVKFLAAHPIAGSEKTGAANAKADLFDGKVIVLTPDDQTNEDLTAKATRFWEMTGGQIVVLSPKDHDTYLAAVSHVPHLVSSAVCRLMPPQAKALVGSGWRDITRVAAGDPDLWTAICQENRAAIQAELERAIEDMNALKSLLENEDDSALTNWLAEAKTIKDQT